MTQPTSTGYTNPLHQCNTSLVIPSVGIYEDISFEDYLSWDAENQSKLKYISESPQTYLSQIANPIEPTRAMILGSALDNFIFDRNYFDRHYCTHKGARRGKNYNTLIDVYGEQFILSEEELVLCYKLKEKIENDKMINGLFHGKGSPQLSLVWVDETTGIICKARIDRFVPDLKLFVDLKSSDNCSPNRWFFHAKKLKYHFQAAFYLMGAKQLGLDVLDFAHVTFETKGANILTPYQISKEDLENGKEQVRAALDTLAKCRKTNKWAGYVKEGEFGQNKTYQKNQENIFFEALMEAF